MIELCPLENKERLLTMDIMQLLFSPNHETPRGWVLAVLILLAVVMPPIMHYVAEHRNRKK